MAHEIPGPPILRKKRLLPKSVRNALISMVVLLGLIVLAGVSYTYIEGQSGPIKTAETAPAAPSEPVIKPVQPSPNAKESVAVEVLTSPVSVGSNASITIQTNAGSNCTISVVYASTASTDSGLTPKKADAYGTVSWTWTVGPSVPTGTWPVKVTCAYHTQTAVVQGDLVVQK